MKHILYEIKDGVGKIVLNRPEVFNSFNRAMAFEMQEALDDATNNNEVRAILITGEGKAFCAGQDLGEVVDPNGPSLTVIISEHYNPIIGRLRALPKPIISAVNGVAAGAGANIALACDICIASENASFIQAFSKIGLIPDSGGTFTLPRLIGFGKASALMMLGDKVNAQEAERIGMIYKVLPAEGFLEETEKMALNLAKMPTKALALTKQALNESLENSFDQQLKLEDNLQTLAGQTHDYKEGVQAFLEKRKPVFIGS
jgi:2-(1,2-epoxy-1,2-dihydrophenyl)acetyl-CoA isomerase